MKRLLCFLLLLSSCASVGLAQQSELQRTAELAKKNGFVSLFNGKDLEGWKANEPKSWSVEDGAIKCEGDVSHLFYVGEHQPVDDFHLIVEVKTTPGSNSGIYFHTEYQDSGWPKKGYEVQVNATHTDPKKSGGLYATADVSNPPIKDNEWYTQEIIVQDNYFVSKINGKVVAEYHEPEGKAAFSKDFERRMGSGTFALQSHDPDSVVYFKNIMLKPMPTLE